MNYSMHRSAVVLNTFYPWLQQEHVEVMEHTSAMLDTDSDMSGKDDNASRPFPEKSNSRDG